MKKSLGTFTDQTTGLSFKLVAGSDGWKKGDTMLSLGLVLPDEFDNRVLDRDTFLEGLRDKPVFGNPAQRYNTVQFSMIHHVFWLDAGPPDSLDKAFDWLKDTAHIDMSDAVKTHIREAAQKTVPQPAGSVSMTAA